MIIKYFKEFKRVIKSWILNVIKAEIYPKEGIFVLIESDMYSIVLILFTLF